MSNAIQVLTDQQPTDEEQEMLERISDVLTEDDDINIIVTALTSLGANYLGLAMRAQGLSEADARARIKDIVTGIAESAARTFQQSK